MKKAGKKVIILVKGGVVTFVTMPEGLEAVVWDYDTEGKDDSLLKADGHGDKYELLHPSQDDMS